MNPAATPLPSAAPASLDLPQLVQGISTIDLVMLILLLLLAIRCAWRGFVRETLDMAGILVGVLFGVLFSGLLAPLFESLLGKSALNQIIAFVLIFGATWFLIYLLRDSLEAVVDNLEMERLDHFLGFFVGLVEGLLVIFLLLFLLNLQQVVPLRDSLEQSIAFRVLSPLFSYADQLILSTVPGASTLGVQAVAPGQP